MTSTTPLRRSCRWPSPCSSTASGWSTSRQRLRKWARQRPSTTWTPSRRRATRASGATGRGRRATSPRCSTTPSTSARSCLATPTGRFTTGFPRTWCPRASAWSSPMRTRRSCRPRCSAASAPSGAPRRRRSGRRWRPRRPTAMPCPTSWRACCSAPSAVAA